MSVLQDHIENGHKMTMFAALPSSLSGHNFVHSRCRRSAEMFPPEFKDEYDELMALVLSVQVTVLPMVSTLLWHSCLCLDRSHPCLYVTCYEMLNESCSCLCGVCGCSIDIVVWSGCICDGECSASIN